MCVHQPGGLLTTVFPGSRDRKERWSQNVKMKEDDRVDVGQ